MKAQNRRNLCLSAGWVSLGAAFFGAWSRNVIELTVGLVATVVLAVVAE